MKVKFILYTGFEGGNYEHVADVSDDHNDDDIQELYTVWVNGKVDLGWERLDD